MSDGRASYENSCVIIIKWLAFIFIFKRECCFQEMQYCKSVVLSLHNDAAIRITMEAMIGGANNTELPPATRVAFLKLLHVFCEQSKADLTEFIPQLLRSLIHLAIETNEGIINTAWDCLNSVVKVVFR